MPQLVLQADWQEVWHSPHPPFAALLQRLRVSIVLMCFIVVTSVKFYVRFIISLYFYKVNSRRNFASKYGDLRIS